MSKRNLRSFYGNQLVDFHFIADANVSILLSNRTKEIVSVCIVFLIQPRANEAGGLYGKGVIVRKYEKNTVMKVRVELTANHMGYFEFRFVKQPYL